LLPIVSESSGGLDQSDVEAVSSLLRQHASPWLGLDVDSMMELLCLLGVALSVAVALSGCDSSWLFAALLSLYAALQGVGHTFLSFQWDILLIETGAIAVLLGSWGWPSCSAGLFARCDRHTQRRQSSSVANGSAQGSGAQADDGSEPPRTLKECASLVLPSSAPSSHALPMFLLRFLLFRLMFASGVVKILSRCPTWSSARLSALEFHYATQPLPTPLAWFAHQLPTEMQQLTLAVTVWIETVGALLLLLPPSVPALSFLRRTAVFLQASLQVAIMLTGNYTFFNWLTLILVAAFVADDEWRAIAKAVRPWKWSCLTRRREKTVQPAVAATAAAVASLSAAASTSSGPSAPVRPRAALTVHRPAARLHALMWSACAFAVHMHLLGLLGWSFGCLYEVRVPVFSTDSAVATAARARFRSVWDAAPSWAQLRELPSGELRFAVLQWLHPLGGLLSVRPLFTPEDMARWIDSHLPSLLAYAAVLAAATVAWTALCLVRSAFHSWLHSRRSSGVMASVRLLVRAVLSFVHFAFLLVACGLLFFVSLVPFTHGLSPAVLHGLPRTQELIGLYRGSVSSFGPVANSYGLFRSMTGVGPEQWVEPQQTTQTQAQMQAEGLAAPTAADSVGLGAVPPAERLFFFFFE
jgi:hypothetical protein